MATGEKFYMVETPDPAKDYWWVVGIFDTSDEAVKAFTIRKGKKDNVRIVECTVIMEYVK